MERVVVQFASQIGRDRGGHPNWIGYVMEHAPASMLVVVPTLEVRKKWHLRRLAPMLRETPVLRAPVRGQEAGRGQLGGHQDIPGRPGGAGQGQFPSSLASMPIKYVLVRRGGQLRDGICGGRRPGRDHPADGDLSAPQDPADLTPKKDRGESIIEGEYEKTDMREFHVPVPHATSTRCCAGSTPTAYGLKRNEATGTVHYYCPLRRAHRGTRKAPHAVQGPLGAAPPGACRPGYHLSALYAPLGLGLTWGQLLDEWQEAQGDTSKLKAFIQLKLGETWENRKEGADPLNLIARLEEYDQDMPRRARSVGIDVQKDRIEMSVYEFGPGRNAGASTT